MKGFKKILFPTDFSANADRALAHAVRIAGFEDGEVIVQHVVGDYFERHPHWATLFDVHEIQKLMDGYVSARMAEILPRDIGRVRMSQVISKGKPAEEIAAVADREMVDLVVMGSAKGVVTNNVIRMTRRPVLAVSATQPPLGSSWPAQGIENPRGHGLFGAFKTSHRLCVRSEANFRLHALHALCHRDQSRY